MLFIMEKFLDISEDSLSNMVFGYEFSGEIGDVSGKSLINEGV